MTPWLHIWNSWCHWLRWLHQMFCLYHKMDHCCYVYGRILLILVLSDQHLSLKLDADYRVKSNSCWSESTGIHDGFAISIAKKNLRPIHYTTSLLGSLWNPVLLIQSSQRDRLPNNTPVEENIVVCRASSEFLPNFCTRMSISPFCIRNVSSSITLSV